MKRGLIAWDRAEIPPRVFQTRIDGFREVLGRLRLPAGVVYSDFWRSNRARSLQNYMPYFNRSLLVVPVDGPSVLICGLSPRVYPWIRSVTPIADVRPGKDFGQALEALASERGWTRIGLLDEGGFPFDVHAGLMNTHLELVDLGAEALECPAPDETEMAMRRKSIAMARLVLESEIADGVGRSDRALAGRLEHGLRRAGAEDLIVLIGHAGRSPAPASGRALAEEFSVSLAVEYRGHWTRISRTHGDGARIRPLVDRFQTMLGRPAGEAGPGAVIEDLSGEYPYRAIDGGAVLPGALAALHAVGEGGDRHWLWGDTCRAHASGWTLL